MKDAVEKVIDHIKKCELCSQLGHICGICNKTNDYLYPFELEKVEKCPNCLSCYHKSCFNSKQNLLEDEKCPRCKRKKERMQQNE
jgi:hypothetical protein